MIQIGHQRVPDVRRWTREAFYCWKRNRICSGCPMGEIMETTCRMKKTVIALFRVFGKPLVDENGYFVYERGKEDDDD